MTTATEAVVVPPAADAVGAFQSEVKNSFAVLAAASVTLASDWDRMPPERRQYMLDLVARRTVELQAMVMPVVARMR